MRKIYLDVINLSGTTIPANSFVATNGTDSGTGLPTVVVADYSTSNAPAIGILTTTLADTQVGLIRIQGTSVGFNTAGSSLNAPVFLGLAGGITFTNPNVIIPSNYSQQVGIVSVVGGDSYGAILLQSSYADESLSTSGTGNVIGSGVINQVSYFTGPTSITSSPNLYWDNTNKQLSIDGYAFVGGYLSVQEGSVPSAVSGFGTLYVKQSDHNLYYVSSVGVTSQITPASGGGGIGGTGSAGQVTFWTDASDVSGNSLFYWDNISNVLAVGSTVYSASSAISSPAYVVFTSLGSTSGTQTQTSSALIFQSSYWSSGLSSSVNSNVVLQASESINSPDSNQLNVYMGDVGSEGTIPVISVTQSSLVPGQSGAIGLGTSTNSWNYVYTSGLFTQALSTSMVTKNTTYSITPTDCTILCDAVSGAFSVTLPDATTLTIGQIFVIKKIDSSANVVTVATSSSQQIDGLTTKSITTQYQSFTVQTDGANWWVIGN